MGPARPIIRQSGSRSSSSFGSRQSYASSTSRIPTQSIITHTVTFLLGIFTCNFLLLHGGLDCSSWEDENNTIGFTSSFTFPSPEERVKYYMGDWYGRTLPPEKIPCNKIAAVDEIISDQSVLWRGSKMKEEIEAKKSYDWLVTSYLMESYDVLNHEKFGREKDEEDWLILYIGDSHSHNTHIPAVAKTRFSRYATDRKSGKPLFKSIILPLELHRHYDPVDEYIQLHKEGYVPKWKDKKSTLIWRGAVTGTDDNSNKKQLTTYVDGGPRIQVVKNYFNVKITDVDVAFEQESPTLAWAPYEYMNEAELARPGVNMAGQLKYKYILMLEGNDVATGLKWQLASNSVVFMAKPTTVSFLMEDLLVPFVHYVPLKDDYSNLIEMVHWARMNDKKCKWISDQATLFMQRLWMSKRAKEENDEMKKKLGETYQKQFGEAAKSCARRIRKEELSPFDW